MPKIYHKGSNHSTLHYIAPKEVQSSQVDFSLCHGRLADQTHAVGRNQNLNLKRLFISTTLKTSATGKCITTSFIILSKPRAPQNFNAVKANNSRCISHRSQQSSLHSSSLELRPQLSTTILGALPLLTRLRRARQRNLRVTLLVRISSFICFICNALETHSKNRQLVTEPSARRVPSPRV